MNKKLMMTATLASAVLSGCATHSTGSFQAFQAEDLNALIKSGTLQQKTNSFLVINDSSSSMSDTYTGDASLSGSKFDVEKDLLNRLNKTIPNIPLSAGLRSFGFGPCLPWAFTHLNQPIGTYSQAGFEGALSTLECSSGGSPAATAIEAASHDLTGASGNIAVILLSDGMNDTSPAPAAQALKAQYGDKLCIYTIWVGNDKDTDGRATLRRTSDVSACGFTTTAGAIASSQGMADFVKRVFLKPGNPPVNNDEDGDGVIDPKDKCPGTPKGAIVDKDGCWAFHGVLFDFDSDKIKSKYHDLFTNAVHVMNINPGLTIEVQGHTDSYGSDAYNQNLSERRAKAVKNELVRQGINGSRLTVVGFGESDPAASNDTDEGRAYNRRVVYKRTDK